MRKCLSVHETNLVFIKFTDLKFPEIFTRFKSTMKTSEQGVKRVQS